MSRNPDLIAASSRMQAALPADLTLQGKYASLEPMQLSHLDDLKAAASDGELWNIKVTSVPSHDACAEYISTALSAREEGVQLPFVVRRKADQKIVGSTRFYVINTANRNLSIGYTWYSKSAQRTVINTQCKFLLLSHAFEDAECISVQWHTHHKNYASQAAIERIGAKQEGILRNHIIDDDGAVRHTYCYSMLENEWPAAKQDLLQKL